MAALTTVADRLRKADDQIRRLQRDVIQEDASISTAGEEGQSAADVLAATADINVEGEEPTADDVEDQ